MYYIKESPDRSSKNKAKEDNNNIKKSYKKKGHKAFLVKKPKIETYINKSKKNDKNKTPEKRKESNNSSDKNEKDEDLVTSFEKKPSELKSPETISESSFTSSNENNDNKNKDKSDDNELIYIDKTKEEINNKTSSNTKEEQKGQKQKEKINKNTNKISNLKITVNKTPKEHLKNREEKAPYIPINQRKKSEIIDGIDKDIGKNKKNEILLLTNIKNVKHKKFFIKTEVQRNKYKKKFINLNFTNKKNDNDNNNISKTSTNNISRNNVKDNNKMKKEKNIIQSQKKNNAILNKNLNNKLNLDFNDSSSTNINKNKTSLSRNISFHNKKKIIYAPKKLINSTILKSQQKSEIIAHKNTKMESNISSNKNNKAKISNNFPKNVNNFFNDNFNNDYSQNSFNNKRYSIRDLNSNQKNKNYEAVISEQIKEGKNLQMINLITPNNIHNHNNNSRNSSLDINNNLNNLYLQNLFQYNFNNNNNINNEANNNSFSINFEDLIILQKYLHEMIFSLSKNKPIHNESFEFWNYYYNSSLLPQIEKVFSNQSDSNEVKISIYYSLMSIMLCYNYSFESNLFIKVIIPLSDILKMNYKNLILICEYILKKISKDCLTNIWVLKLASIVKESNFNDYTNQILKRYNFTLVEKISYNTNIILQNLRYLLKNFKSTKNAILTGIFKKIREKTYEEINIFFRENILHVSNLNGSILGSIFLLKNTNFHPVPNPYVRTKNSKEYSLVLDLDETLIHFKPQNNGEDGGILRVRPGIYEFLDEIGKYYELIVFTTATQDYADVLIDAVEEDKIYFEHRFYREHATIIDNDFVKDLTRIGRPLDKIIIVDNMPQNFRLQKENGIIIKAFWGEDDTDMALFALKNILINIAKDGGDIRKGLVKYKNDIVKKVTSCFSKNY